VAGGVQVGEGYIDIDPRIDSKGMQAAALRSSKDFTKTFQDNWNKEMRKFKPSGISGLSMNKEMSSMAALNRQRIASEQKLHKLRLDNAKALTKETTQVIRQKVKVDKDGDHIGRMFGRHFMGGVEGVLSLLPSRLEGLFTNTGPIAGTAFFAAFAAAFALGLPALGAMTAGLLFGGLGLGAVLAAGIVAAIDDPRVSKSASKLAENFKKKIIFHPDVMFLGDVLAKQIDKVNKALDRWAPHIREILQAGARFLPSITNGLIGMVDAFLGPMAKLMNSPFMQALMGTISQGLVKIGEAFGVSFDRFLDDPQAMKGAIMGLEDFFNLIAGGIKTMFDFLRLMSRLWVVLNQHNGVIDNMRQTWKIIRDIFNGTVGVIAKVVSWFGQLGKAAGGFGNTGQQIAQTWKAIVDSVVTVGRKIADFFVRLWHDVGPQVLQTLGALWRNIVTIIQGAVQVIRGIFQVVKGIFTADWNTVWTGLKNIASGALKIIVNIIRGGLNAAWAIFRVVLGVLNMVWQAFWARLWAHLKAWYHNVLAFTKGWWTNMKNWFNNSLRWIKGLWNFIWGSIKSFAVGIWNSIYNWVANRINAIRNIVSSVLAIIRARWNFIWTLIRTFARAVWSSVHDWVVDRFRAIQAFISRTLDAIKKKWNDIWGGVKNFFAGIWTSIRNSAINGINLVLGVINRGIDIINGALGKLGVSFRIGKIPLVGAASAASAADKAKKLAGKASGGRMRGPGTTTSDSIPVRLSKDEYVIRAKSARKIGYNNLDYLNRHGPQGIGLAGGGRVGGGNNALLEAHRNHLHVAMQQGYQYVMALARASKIGGYSISSTFRPGDPLWHGKGKAVDFGGFNQDRLASFFAGRPGLLELIHRTAARDYAFFGGSGGGNLGKGGILSGIFGFLGKGWDYVKKKILGPVGEKAANLFGKDPKNGVMALGKGWIKALFDQASGKSKKEFDDAKKNMAAGAMSGAGGSPGGAGKWAGVAASALRMLGLPGNWLTPLLARINQESGGNPRAINLWDSNAKKGIPSMGLMQTIGPTFNAYKLPGMGDVWNPLHNIIAGLRYIKSRYGSIFNLPAGGYDNGGYLQPGLFNGTSVPEPVFTGSQWEILKGNMSSNSSTNVTVFVDGVATAHKAVVEQNNLDLIRDLNRGF